MDGVTFYTAAETATRLGVNPSRVRQLAAALGIGQKVGRDWLFSDADIEHLRQRKTTPGRTKSATNTTR